MQGLDFFFNLQAELADPSEAIRRYAAHFLERLLLSKPSLSLRCTPAILALLADSDGPVQELAVKAAAAHHGRALFALSQEQDGLQCQRLAEQLQQLQDKVRAILETAGPALLSAGVHWAQVLVLAQTPSPLLLRARVPPELRGVSCLQDLLASRAEGPQGGRQAGAVPIGAAASGAAAGIATLDPAALVTQAEGLFDLLCRLLQQAGSSGGDARLQVLLRCAGSIARQRPSLLPAAIEVFRSLLLQPSKEGSGMDKVHDLVKEQLQLLLASGLTSEWQAELVSLLQSSGRLGSLEDLVTQAKYRQICAMADKEGDGPACPRPKKKARKIEPARHVWTPRRNPGAEEGRSLLEEESAFDSDALLSGEAEATCRRFEDYFGLPSQREPAGHVPGPALLATRISSQAELARIALTSLSSLSLQRSLHRDRANERAVAFNVEVGLSAAKSALSGGDGASPELLAFLVDGLRPASETTRDGSGGATTKPDDGPERDPRAMMRPDVNDGQKSSEVETITKTLPLVAVQPASLQLPQDPAQKDALQLKLFEEVLESQRRMEGSVLRAGLSVQQIPAYEQLSRQVALHLASSSRTAANPGLQRAMCQSYVLRAFDALKAALAAANPPEARDCLDKLVDLFYAKFATDVARWQETASPQALSKPPLREILEAGGAARRANTTGFTYAELFEMCLAEFEKREIPRKELRHFLGELPAVPLSAFRALEAQCQLAGARKMALLTVLSLIEGKPACRWRGLHLLFKLAFSGGEDSGVRFDTIRLIINKIYSADQHLPMRWQLPHLTEVEAVPLLDMAEGLPGVMPGASWELPDPDFLPLQRLRGRSVEDIATLMLRSVAAPDAQFAHPVGVPLRLEQLRADLFKGSICAPKDRVWLYLALCIKRPVLLHGLVETFTLCEAEMKEHLINSIEEAIKYIPVSEQELLVLVQKAGAETEPLVLKVLTILMQTSRGKDSLQPAFGEAVTRLYKVTQNPRLLVPVFDLLERRSLLEFLPCVLQLEIDQVTDAFKQLVQSKNPPLSVTELLTELHQMNVPGENIVPIKCSMQALNIIFSMKDQFDPKVYGIVIQSLVEDPGPLPTLFMRTVIQVVKELPRLSDFVVMEILPRLVRTEVWGDENMWRGFMIVLQHTFASQPGGAARVLAMLPMSQLEDVLVQHPDWKSQLREFVARQPSGVPPHVRQLLE
ncbi:unnamed protein product [Polarella glacialis]|uniref:Symplekin C-terminal domain-containing protein n=1 Tax=Polarella glacialis TaxID=89957 RepID=A0A813DRA3_POLGL|nr:unnamed protein product [Polarella glacialis]